MLREEIEHVRMLAREEIDKNTSAAVKGVVAKEVKKATSKITKVINVLEDKVKSLEDKIESLEVKPVDSSMFPE